MGDIGEKRRKRIEGEPIRTPSREPIKTPAKTPERKREKVPAGV